MPYTPQTAVDAIASEITLQGITDADPVSMAEGLLGGMIIGYGMDPAAFLAVHGGRLPHLTRQALRAGGREIVAEPGEMPRTM